MTHWTKFERDLPVSPQIAAMRLADYQCMRCLGERTIPAGLDVNGEPDSDECPDCKVPDEDAA